MVEDCDSFCTATSHNSTGLILHQHSESTLFSMTHILNQNILAKAGERVLETIKGDVMPLPHSAAHTIADFLCALPLSVLTHASVAVNTDGLSCCIWLVVMVTGTLLRFDAVSAVTYCAWWTEAAGDAGKTDTRQIQVLAGSRTLQALFSCITLRTNKWGRALCCPALSGWCKVIIIEEVGQI